MFGKFIKSQVQAKVEKTLGVQLSTSQSSGKPYMSPWPIATPKYAVTINGQEERQIYSYDSSPLKGVRKGQVVTVELFRGDGAMVSTCTGYYADTKDRHDCIVLYEGRPIGFIAFPVEKLRRAAEMGYAIMLSAKCYGPLEGYPGIKEMRALVPHRFYLVDWIPGAEDDRPLRERENYFHYNEYDEADFRNLITKYEWDFEDARLEMIPTPAKSSAKPHIGVYSKEGMLISEVTARNSCYKKLIEFMEQYDSFRVVAKRVTSEIDGTLWYSIEILGF